MASKILFTIAGIIAVAIVVLFLMIASGNEAAIRFGGLAMLFLGVPILVLFFVCLGVGFALRDGGTKTARDPAKAPKRRRGLAVAATVLGAIMLAMIGAELFLFLLATTPASALADVPQNGQSKFWFAMLFSMFDLKLPIALVLLMFGARRLRQDAHPV